MSTTDEAEAAWPVYRDTHPVNNTPEQRHAFIAGYFAARIVAEEPEWEYGWEADEDVRTTTRPRGPRILFDGVPYPPEAIAAFARGRRIRRRKAGPWVEVPDA